MANRLEEEHREREEKKKRKSAVRSNPQKVSITMRPKRVPTKKGAVAKGTLDNFVTRRPSSSSSDIVESSPEQESSPELHVDKPKKSKGTLVQKGITDFLGKSVTKGEQSIYKDVSTDDPDDPDSDSDLDISSLPKDTLIKKLKLEVSYVIFNHEGAYFPGQIKEIKKKTVRIKAMKKTGLRTWSWPDTYSLHECHIHQIYHIIPPPKVGK